MLEAIIITRSIRVHRDMKYHAIDENHNYSAKTIERLVLIMSKDGALFEDSTDSGFSVTILNNRTVVGTGILIIDNIFRIILNDGSIQDYDSDGNLVEYGD
jgi:hypothetical protein